MTIFDMAKQNYNRNLWTLEMLQTLVRNFKLTSAQYFEITEKEYSE